MPYHFVSFGEAMVRLCPPGFGRVEMATSLEMQPGGAELNTAVGVARLGLAEKVETAWVSRLPHNPLGRYLANKGREHGVSTDEIVWDAHPDAFAKAASEIGQRQPSLLEALLGNKALMMGAAVLGAKILGDIANRQRAGGQTRKGPF